MRLKQAYWKALSKQNFNKVYISLNNFNMSLKFPRKCFLKLGKIRLMQEFENLFH